MDTLVFRLVVTWHLVCSVLVNKTIHKTVLGLIQHLSVNCFIDGYNSSMNDS